MLKKKKKTEQKNSASLMEVKYIKMTKKYFNLFVFINISAHLPD